MTDEKRSFQSLKNNAQGQFFEQQIERACNYYREKNIANIHKTPEPFRVIKKIRWREIYRAIHKKSRAGLQRSFYDRTSDSF